MLPFGRELEIIQIFNIIVIEFVSNVLYSYGRIMRLIVLHFIILTVTYRRSLYVIVDSMYQFLNNVYLPIDMMSISYWLLLCITLGVLHLKCNQTRKRREKNNVILLVQRCLIKS